MAAGVSIQGAELRLTLPPARPISLVLVCRELAPNRQAEKTLVMRVCCRPVLNPLDTGAMTHWRTPLTGIRSPACVYRVVTHFQI